MFFKVFDVFFLRISYRWRVAIICSTIKNDLNYACFDLLWLLRTRSFAVVIFFSTHFNLQSAAHCMQRAMLIVIPLPIQTFKLSLAQIHIYESCYCNIIAYDIIYWQLFFLHSMQILVNGKWNRQKVSLFKWNAINVYVKCICILKYEFRLLCGFTNNARSICIDCGKPLNIKNRIENTWKMEFSALFVLVILQKSSQSVTFSKFPRFQHE